MTETAQWISWAEYEAAVHAFVGDPGRWNPQEVSGLLDAYGALAAPISLYAMAHTPGFPLELVRPRVMHTFAGSLRPEIVMKRHAWISLFRRIGYTFNGQPALAPMQPVTLWRGCHPDYLDNLTWTPYRDVAVVFADRPGRNLYRAEVGPGRVLATLDVGQAHPPQCVVAMAGVRPELEPLTAADRETAAQYRADAGREWARMAKKDRDDVRAVQSFFEKWER